MTFTEGRLSSRMGFVVDGIVADRMGRAEAEIDAVIATFVAEGPTAAELERARTARMRYMFGLQESTSGKAFLLSRGVGQVGDEDYADRYVRELRAATPQTVRDVARSVYGRPGYRLILRPTPALRATGGGYDLTQGPPPVGSIAPIALPATERAVLSNGLTVVLVRRPGTTAGNALLRFDDAGAAASSRHVAAMALDVLARKATTPDDRAWTERSQALGTWISGGVDDDHADLTMRWDAGDPSAGIALLGQMVTKPAITADAVAALRKAYVDRLAATNVDRFAATERALDEALDGGGRPDASAAAIQRVEAIDAGTIRAWYRDRLRPDRATLYVAADAELATLRPLLEKALAGWTVAGPAMPAPAIPPAHGRAAPSLTVVDVPGAQQTYIMAGRMLSAVGRPGGVDATAAWAANEIYGGNPSARIGTSLREEKGWTYGIGSGLDAQRGRRRWILAGSVDAEHSGASVAELIEEMRGLTGDRPPTQAEVDRVAIATANQNAAKLENGANLLKAMADARSEGLPYDDVVRMPARVQALTLDQVRRAAADLLDPDTMHWAIAGDWHRIKDQFAGLNLGEIQVVPGRR